MTLEWAKRKKIFFLNHNTKQKIFKNFKMTIWKNKIRSIYSSKDIIKKYTDNV